MANTNVAFGLRPIGVVGQGYNTTGATEYRIASGNTNAIFQGSPVIPLSTGFIDRVGAAAGGTVGLVGVFAGAEYVSSTTGEKVFLTTGLDLARILIFPSKVLCTTIHYNHL